MVHTFLTKRLARKIFVPTLIIQIVAVVVAITISSFYSLNLVKQQLRARISSYSSSTAEKLNSSFEKWANTTVLHARMIDAKSGAISLELAGELAQLFVSQDDNIVGGGSWWDYYKLDPKTRYAVRYFSNDHGKLTDVSADYATGNDDFPKDNWFQIVKDSKDPTDFRWTDPYHDPVVNIDMVTCSAPFYGKGHEWIGLVTSDISLGTLQRLVSDIKLGRNGYAFLVAANGRFISHPRYTMDETLATVESGRYKDLWAWLSRGETGIESLNTIEGEVSFAFEKVASPHWILAISIPSEIVEDAASQIALQAVIVLLVVILIVAFLISLMIRSMVALPLRTISTGLKAIADEGEADLTRELKISSGDEIGQMAGHFNNFQKKLSSLFRATRLSLENLSQVGMDLSANTTQTATALNQIAANIASVRREISQQAEATGASLGSVEKINATIDDLDQRMDTQAACIVESTRAIEKMVQDIHTVTEIVGQMDKGYSVLSTISTESQRKLGEVNDRMHKVLASSAQLQETNSIIANIASQTNLLAMNAAIEAAHAGESGRGFSVVADEIRKLAESSAEQSKTTRAMLKAIRESIGTASTASQEVEQSFQDFLAHHEQLASLEKQIEVSMKSQSTESDQILRSLQKLDLSTQDVRQGAAQVHELNERITAEIQSLHQLSTEINSSMDEISLGTNEINTAVTSISEMSRKNRIVIENVQASIKRFRIPEGS